MALRAKVDQALSRESSDITTALFVSVDHVVASPEAVTRREGHDQWRRKPLYESNSRWSRRISSYVSSYLARSFRRASRYSTWTWSRRN